MLWAHCKGHMGACVPMCMGLVTCLTAWQCMPWVLSWKCCDQQNALACLSYERWCAGSIVCKELILLHDSALFIEQQLTEHCKMLLSVLCWSPDLALHGSPFPMMAVAPRLHKKLFTCMQKLHCRQSHLVASRNGCNNCTNISKSMWLQVNISSRVTCL